MRCQKKDWYADDAKCLQGEFVNAYCKFFSCSADYLFGYTDIRTPNIEVRHICEITGLSETVINRLLEDFKSEETVHRCQTWSKMLESELYYGIVYNWWMAGEQAMIATQKEVEREKLIKDLKKASGPDVLDIRADLEGVENDYKSANAAYAGLLFNISRNVSEFVECSLRSKINMYKKLLDEAYQ